MSSNFTRDNNLTVFNINSFAKKNSVFNTGSLQGIKIISKKSIFFISEISTVFKEYMYEEFKKILKYFTLTKYL